MTQVVWEKRVFLWLKYSAPFLSLFSTEIHIQEAVVLFPISGLFEHWILLSSLFVHEQWAAWQRWQEMFSCVIKDTDALAVSLRQGHRLVSHQQSEDAFPHNVPRMVWNVTRQVPCGPMNGFTLHWPENKHNSNSWISMKTLPKGTQRQPLSPS